jgi:hypothetical protein
VDRREFVVVEGGRGGARSVGAVHLALRKALRKGSAGGSTYGIKDRSA